MIKLLRHILGGSVLWFYLITLPTGVFVGTAMQYMIGLTGTAGQLDGVLFGPVMLVIVVAAFLGAPDSIFDVNLTVFVVTY